MARGRPSTREIGSRQIVVERRPSLRRMTSSSAANGRLDIDTGQMPPKAEDIWPEKPVGATHAAPEPPVVDADEEDTPSRRRDPVRMAAHFEEMVEKKVSNLLDDFDALKILSDRSRYVYDDAQIQEVKQALAEAYKETMAAFDAGSGSKRQFRLKSRRRT